MSVHTPLAPVTASISLPCIAHNLFVVRNSIPPDCQILPIIKAEGYGHGAVRVAHALAQLGIRQFGVSTVEEGLELRANGIQGTILVLGGLLPSHVPEMVRQRLTPVLSSVEIAQVLAEVVASHSAPYVVHIKVHTGMGRLGMSPDQLLTMLNAPLFEGPLRVGGLMTHFAEADHEDPTGTKEQITRFQALINRLHRSGRRVPLLHASNTAAIISHPAAHFGMVRPGLMLYGYGPTRRLQQGLQLQPAMRVTTHIVHIRRTKAGDPLSYYGTYRTTRPSRIAILPVGYSHGLNRKLSNTGLVLIGGHRAPIVGNICMDMTLIDVTDVPGVTVGDEVILLGRQGTQDISAHDVADWQGTIPYEVLCAIGPKVRRIYEPLPEPLPGGGLGL